jgi:HEAT repeat protein
MRWLQNFLHGVDWAMVLLKLAMTIVSAIAVAMTANAIFNMGNRTGNPTAEITIEDRIKVLTRSLNSAASAIGEIESEVKERQALVEKLKNDAETAKNLRALHREQVDAIAQVLRGQIEKEQKIVFGRTKALPSSIRFWAFCSQRGSDGSCGSVLKGNE